MMYTLTILRFILISLLLVSHSGVPVVVHRCGGEVESVHVFSTTAQCSDDAECEDMGCCTNTLVVSQLSVDAATVPQLELTQPQIVDCDLPRSSTLLSLTYSSVEVAECRHDHTHRRPPPLLVAMRC